ncbi:MAG: AbrB/MazE/SpoVT family DNA-binding domain-containing protein [Oscillospiraceae bacterium]|jgi:AbrB family looped-hinge helix DNA binding protein|nr:AbrB/MazE/SpoVT family DNA-binding domain-containing protein [Oscillospiraceae bacterium]
METVLNTAKIMSKGQITLPIDIRKVMGLSIGDRVALISDGKRIIIMNPAMYAMEVMQKEMAGKWEEVGVDSEEDLLQMVAETRKKYKK